VIALASMPYLYALQVESPGLRFGGFVLNPLDGNSYLAKMEQGRRGAWGFRLPYSAEPGPAALVFFYYILLGHFAGWTGLSSLTVYHAARLAAAAVFLAALYAFIARFFAQPALRLAAWALITVGSGLGWLAASAGLITSDLWVAEAIVFLSILQSPHFLTAGVLMLALFFLVAPGLAAPRLTWGQAMAIAVAASALANVQPLVLIAVAAVAWTATLAPLAWAALRSSRPALTLSANPHLPQALCLSAAATPWLLYDAWLSRSHPAVQVWTAQNQTLSPPLWDYLITFSPALGLAAVGAWHGLRRKAPLDRFLLAWLLASALLLYAPWSFQRRFTHGLSIPVGILAIQGMSHLIPPTQGRRHALALAGLAALALPTNLLVLAATTAGLATRSSMIFIAEEEARALQWLDTHAAPNALVLASPELGLLIPAYTARRVIYGHPFETVHAGAEEAAVTQFYADPGSTQAAAAFLEARHVDFVIFGPREARLGPGPDPASLALMPVFNDGELTIYQVSP
jgi:hypothetical protein